MSTHLYECRVGNDATGCMRIGRGYSRCVGSWLVNEFDSIRFASIEIEEIEESRFCISATLPNMFDTRYDSKSNGSFLKGGDRLSW